MGVDCEEVWACLVDSADDEVGSDVALVADEVEQSVSPRSRDGPITWCLNVKELSNSPVKILLQHRHRRHDLRFPPTGQRV